MSPASTKPYLLRAIYEWCADNGFTPHLLVAVDGQTRVPMEYVKDGEIVLNIGANSSRNLLIGNDLIQFSARFGGAARDIEIPMRAVLAIYARENGEGLSFPREVGDESSVESAPPEDRPPTGPRGKPNLKLVK